MKDTEMDFGKNGDKSPIKERCAMPGPTPALGPTTGKARTLTGRRIAHDHVIRKPPRTVPHGPRRIPYDPLRSGIEPLNTMELAEP